MQSPLMPRFLVMCDKHLVPIESCQRCLTALDCNAMQALQDKRSTNGTF